MLDPDRVKKVYCVDCEYRFFEWFDFENGKCSHPKHRECRRYDYVQKEKELYPFCGHINRSGYCTEFKKSTYIWEKLFTKLKNYVTNI